MDDGRGARGLHAQDTDAMLFMALLQTRCYGTAMLWTTSKVEARVAPLVLGVFLTALSCNGTQATKEPTCEDLDRGLERDQCYHQLIEDLPVSKVDDVIKAAGLIDDPMIRGTAVSSWAANHTQELPKEKCQGICELLEGRDRSYCQRRCSSPHLQR